MSIPKWNDPDLSAGTMVRTGLWLVSVVGIGNSFTKEQHRKAFAGVSQADRRLRDLRKFGWVIHTNTQDVTLRSNEQRLVSVGVPVWEVGARAAVTAIAAISAKERLAALAEYDYQCAVCGIAGGERYPDAPQMTAVLSVSRRKCNRNGEESSTGLIPECARCRAGGKDFEVKLDVLLAHITGIDEAQRQSLLRWIRAGRRGEIDRVWGMYRRLPRAAQEEVRAYLERKS